MVIQPTKKRTEVEKAASPPKAKKNAIKYDEESDGIIDYDDRLLKDHLGVE
jgi:hypothetical protein